MINTTPDFKRKDIVKWLILIFLIFSFCKVMLFSDPSIDNFKSSGIIFNNFSEKHEQYELLSAAVDICYVTGKSLCPSSTKFAKALVGGSSAFLRAVKERYNWKTFQSQDYAPHGSVLGHEADLIWPRSHERFSSLGPVVQCPKSLLKIFGTGDDEKRFCDIFSSADDVCVFLSIGLGTSWGFELEVNKRFPECTIHTLDCTVGEVSVPDVLVSRTIFHRLCLARSTFVDSNGWQFVDWRNLTTLLSLKSRPRMMKIDVEGYEWDLIPDIVDSGYLAPYSFSVELHFQTPMRLPWTGRYKSPIEIGSWMDYLFFHGGYMLTDRHDNVYCPVCSEIVITKLIDPSNQSVYFI